jgi:hypothetical protein
VKVFAIRCFAFVPTDTMITPLGPAAFLRGMMVRARMTGTVAEEAPSHE